MELWMGNDSQAIAEQAADRIEEFIRRKPDAVLGLATGSTPLATYRELIRRYRLGRIDFSQVRTFNLDEYYGLSPDHPQSYHNYMYEHLFRHINIEKQNIHIPSGTAPDVEAYCREYEETIAACGGIDLQLLGIGVNGHIGFNEPAEELEPGTHFVKLSDETIAANSRFFASLEEVPRYAITMGMSTIMSARKILLLAEGEGKAQIIRQMFDSGITTGIPASFLRLHHDVTVLVDRQAGRYLMNGREGAGAR